MDDRKRIAFLCHPYHRGGVTRWMADAAIAYAKNGHEVYFMTLEPIRPFLSGLDRETMLELLEKENAGIHIIKIKVGRSFEFGIIDYRVFIYQQLLIQLPLGTPVILSDDGAVWQAATSLYSSFPVIGVMHSDNNYYYDLAIKYCKEVAILTCVSHRIQKKVVDMLGRAYKDNARVIPCGIKLPSIYTNNRTADLLQLVYIGRLVDAAKRLGDLVKIGSELVREGIKFHLSIIGDGEERKSLEKRFLDKELIKYVTFYGWLAQEEVAYYLNCSDILLLTSDFEGLPIVMMEALASGCGFVGTRVSGVEDYEHVLLTLNCFMVYSVGDINDAVSKIIKLGAMPVEIRQNAARRMAESNFSMEICMERYSKAIAEIPINIYTEPIVNFSPLKRVYSLVISFARYIKLRFRSV